MHLPQGAVLDTEKWFGLKSLGLIDRALNTHRFKFLNVLVTSRNTGEQLVQFFPCASENTRVDTAIMPRYIGTRCELPDSNVQATIALPARITAASVDVAGKVDVVVAGVGTGGSITGISRAIKLDFGKQITSVAVEPTESPVITQTLNGEEVKPGPHKIQGIGAGFIPKNLDLSLIDRVERVSSEEAIKTARRVMAEEGILVGISSGAAVAAADRIAKLPENKDKVIVAILPSASERYLSTVLFEGVE